MTFVNSRCEGSGYIDSSQQLVRATGVVTGGAGKRNGHEGPEVRGVPAVRLVQHRRAGPARPEAMTEDTSAPRGGPTNPVVMRGSVGFPAGDADLELQGEGGREGGDEQVRDAETTPGVEREEKEVPLSTGATEAGVALEVLLPRPDPFCPMCGVHIGTVGRFGKHFASRHAAATVVYKCRKCGRVNANSHSISCHVPKCREGTGGEEGHQGEFACQLCPARFQRKVGLTQHRRLAHPADWNREKREAGGGKGRLRATKLWSVEELRILVELSRRHSEDPNVNKIVAEALGTGKTAEQVRSKRRLLAAELALESPDMAVIDEVMDPLEALADAVVRQSPPNSVQMELREAIESGGDRRSRNEIRAIQVLLREVDHNPEVIESSASELVRRLGGRGGAPGQQGGECVGPARMGWERRLSRKRRDYRVHQWLYSSDPVRLAALVLDGSDGVECKIPIQRIHEAFRERWETESAFNGLGGFRSVGTADNGEFAYPILAAEVRENLNGIKKSSAPGPDRISKQALLDWDPRGEQLARLFTAWLVHGVIPAAFKECRTRLLPKSADAGELEDVSG